MKERNSYLTFLAALSAFMFGNKTKLEVQKAFADYAQGRNSHMSGASVRPKHWFHQRHFGTFKPLLQIPGFKPDRFGRLGLSEKKWKRNGVQHG